MDPLAVFPSLRDPLSSTCEAQRGFPKWRVLSEIVRPPTWPYGVLGGRRASEIVTREHENYDYK